MSASQATIDLLTDYYAAMETNDPALYSTRYADDMTLVFGNGAPITGREDVTTAFASVLARVRSLHHDLVRVWEQDGGVVVYESVGTWNLLDGTSVSVPACTVLTVSGGLFTDQRIYVDNAPVTAALEREAAEADARGQRPEDARSAG